MGTMKRILDLPEDLVADEIISRVPITSLGSVRSTCKKWNTLCKNRIFFGEGAKKQFLMMDSRRICLMNFDQSKENGDPSIKQISTLDQIQIFKVFHCDDGLLLCVDYSRLLVWNPYLGKTRWIHSTFHISYFIFHTGHNNLNHKILRIYDEIQPDPVTGRYVSGFELYDFSSRFWKALDDVTPERQIWSRLYDGVSLKGNAYFRTKVAGFFVCFDFTTERFGPLLPLQPSHSYEDGFHFLSFSCVRREGGEEQQLALLYQHWNTRDTIEISVTDKVGPDVVSWTKFLKVVTGFWVDLSSGSFLIDEEKKLAVVFVLEKVSEECVYQTAHVFGRDGYFKSVRIREAPNLSSSPYKRYYPPLLCSSYLPSLLQLS